MSAYVQGPKRTPEHDTEDLLAEIRAKKEGVRRSDQPPAASDAPLLPPVGPTGTAQGRVEVPPIISSVLSSPDRELLISMARILSRDAERANKRVVFCTPVGDITCRYLWVSSTMPSRVDELFFLKIRTSDMVFAPKAGALMDIKLGEEESPTRVMCMMAPMRIYEGVDLLCFMPHNDPVQKNGRLNEDAPSVVSGTPSSKVIAGEPVAAGEAPAQVDTEKFAKVASRDFDKPRDAE